MGYDPPIAPGAEGRTVDEHRAVVAQAEAAFPCLFQALEDQGGVGADAERVLTFHLADLFHQCGQVPKSGSASCRQAPIKAMTPKRKRILHFMTQK